MFNATCVRETTSVKYFYGIEQIEKQAWVLAPDIGQCLAKSRFMSDEGCFKTDTVVRREVEKNYDDDDDDSTKILKKI